MERLAPRIEPLCINQDQEVHLLPLRLEALGYLIGHEAPAAKAP
jgi:hypothetical protein